MTETTPFINKNLVSIEVILGGDHGQGAFRWPVKIVLRYTQNQVKSIERWFGEVVCMKDTYDLLKHTLAKPITEGLKRMMENDVATGAGHDGRIVFDLTTSHTRYALKGEENTDESRFLMLPFRIHFSGDLAFLAMCLGKPGSSSMYCYLCDLLHSEWQTKDHEKGNMWNLASLSEQLTKLIPKKPNKGVTRPILFDSIGIDRYCLPLLHSLLGIGNHLADDLMKTLDEMEGLDNIPEHLRTARMEYFRKLATKLDSEEEFEIWAELEGIKLVDYRKDKTLLINHLKKNKKSMTRADIDLAEKDKKFMSEEIT